MNKVFYFKNKQFDFHIKIFFLEVKIYLGSFLSLLLALFNPRNYISLSKIYKNSDNRNILIIELNNLHSEIFPSWLFYLKEMSYEGKIFFLASNAIHEMRPFDLIDEKENSGYFFYKMNPKIILLCFKLGLFRKYKKVIFNSDIFYTSYIDSSYSHLLDAVKRKAVFKNTILSSHLILQTMSHMGSLQHMQNKVTTISPSISKDTNIKYVVPLLNNNLVKSGINEKSFNQKKAFVSCGNIRVKEKDSAGLELALEETKKYRKNIEIIGKAPKSLMKNCDVNFSRKRVSSSQLKLISQNSHFILFLLNNSISYRYKFNSASGSLSLALNFNLIPIIEESFAKFYNLDKTNAILYKEGELGRAIKSACEMQYSKYLEMQSSLNSLKLKLKEGSLSNLDIMLRDPNYKE